jgi:hypothetical protein
MGCFDFLEGRVIETRKVGSAAAAHAAEAAAQRVQVELLPR